MLNSFWQWLKQLWNQLWGRSPQTNRATSRQTHTVKTSPLTPADYEFLWTQLLEGVVHDWDRYRIAKFFAQVEDRTTAAAWLDWLGTFGKKVLASPQPNLELARRLELVATHTQHLPEYKEVALLANYICHELRQRATSGVVWEYDGPDA